MSEPIQQDIVDTADTHPLVIAPRLKVGEGIFGLCNDLGEPIHPGDAVICDGAVYAFKGACLESVGGGWRCRIQSGGKTGPCRSLPIADAAAGLRLAAPTREAVHACMAEAGRRSADGSFTREALNEVMAKRGYSPFADHAALTAFLDANSDPAADEAVMRELEKLIAPVMRGQDDMTLGQAAAALGMTFRQLWDLATVNARENALN